MREIMLYGRGYLPEVTLTSPLIDLGGNKNLMSIHWDADTPPGTEIRIRTRTGDDLMEVKRFFKKNGMEVTELQYNKLLVFDKGEIVTEYLPGKGWSSWSQYYLHSGDPISSPSPRKYLLIQTELLSEDRDAYALLRSITLDFRKPLAKQVITELSPKMLDRLGVPQDFSLFIHPTFLPADPGFDEILVEAPSGVAMEVTEVRLGREEDFSGGIAQVIGLADLALASTASDSIWVRLSETVKIGGADLVELRFRSTLFLSGAAFKVFIGNSSRDHSWQGVDEGDATELVDSQRLTVFAVLSDRIIGDVEISPNPFTPNGDGMNDETRFHFTVFKLNTGRPVRITIHDLSGKKLRCLREHRSDSASGKYTILWDGKDDGGHVVSPGLYVCRLSAAVDSDSAQDATLIHTVYVSY